LYIKATTPETMMKNATPMPTEQPIKAFLLSVLVPSCIAEVTEGGASKVVDAVLADVAVVDMNKASM
jgi:hypothetical protein